MVTPINEEIIEMLGLNAQQKRRLTYLLDTGRAEQAVREGLAEWSPRAIR